MKRKNQDDQADKNMNHLSVGARGTKRTPEDEEREEAKR